MIETDFEPADALLTCRVNGELRQMASTRDMLFPVQNLVAFASSIMTLYPGDVILTGTPVGSALLRFGRLTPRAPSPKPISPSTCTPSRGLGPPGVLRTRLLLPGWGRRGGEGGAPQRGQRQITASFALLRPPPRGR